MAVAFGSRYPVPPFSPDARDLPDGSVEDGGIIYIPLPRAAQVIGYESRQALYMALRRQRIAVSDVRQRPLPDGCRLYIRADAIEAYGRQRASRRRRPSSEM